MSNVLEAIYKRRSIRKYTDEPVSDEQLDAILALGHPAQEPPAHGAPDVDRSRVRYV